MAHLTHGMDLEQVEEMALDLRRRAGALETVAAAIDRRVQSTSWSGSDADQFRRTWWPSHRAELLAAAHGLDGLGQAAHNNVIEQRRASEDIVGSVGGVAASAGAGLGISDRQNGVRTLLAALAGTDNPNSIGRDEILVRRMPDGRYIVVLPGVTDLSDGFREPGFGGPLRTWFGRSEYDSIRDMRGAIPTAFDPYRSDPYAEQVKRAMRAAGVPDGADVMLVGHSYGGYAAMHLAADRSFNGDGDGYSVHVTDVVSFGAATRHYLSAVPEGTNALVVGHQLDVPYRVEALIDSGSPESGGHHTVEFGGNPLKVTIGAGHAPAHYENWLLDGGFDDKTGAILDGIGSRYGGPGDPIRVSVPEVGPPAVRTGPMPGRGDGAW